MEQVQHILADQIIDPVVPMRSDLDREKIDDLAASIKSEGLINPITIRPVGDKYEVVAGHRRLKACLIAGIIRIPCVIRVMTDSEVFALRAHENLFRDDVDPVDEAVYIARIIGDDEAAIPALAKKLNRSPQWIEDRLTIMTYPDYLLTALKSGKITLGVAKWLAQIDDDVYRKMFVDQAASNGLAVWQAETYYRQWTAGIFRSSSEIIPAADDVDRPAPAKVRAKCARCAQLAEEPNLQNVFIHIECPAEPTTSSVS